MNRTAALFVSLSLLSAPGPVGAEKAIPRPEIVGVRVGFEGQSQGERSAKYKAGLWTPVELTLRGVEQLRGGRVILTVPDGDGVPSRVSAPLPDVQAGGEVSLLMYARFGRIASQLAVELRSADGLAVKLRSADGLTPKRVFKAGDDDAFPPAISSHQELIVVVGSASLGVEDAVDRLRQKPEEKTVVVKLDDFRRLPDRWYGYEGVDTVVLSTSDPSVYGELKPDSRRVAALDEWVRMGGKLVFCVGQQGEEVLRQESEAPLRRFAPGRLRKVVPLRQTGALEAYCGSSVPVPAPAGGGQLEMHTAQLADVEGTIEAREADDLPLVIRRARGFGQIVFLAADLDRPPLADWKDRGLLVGKLLDHPKTPGEEADEGTALMHYGFNDLAGQLRSALDRFPGVSLVPFYVVVLLIVLYLLAIGPGDYFLLRKVLRRMQLTWITFPLIVLAVSLGAYLLAARFKGNQVRLNQVDLVDVDAETGRLRGTAWVNVFSPRVDRYNLAFQPKRPGGEVLPGARVWTAWLGLPGEALGGMAPKTAEPGVWKTPYDFSPKLDRLAGVPIQVGSTKSLTARWTAPAAPAEIYLEASLREEDNLPNGTITNRLDFPLSQCLLAYGNWAYDLDTIAPGETVRVGPSLKRRELKTLLTGRKLIFDKTEEKFRQQATPYDQAGVDVAYIVRAMMFFDAAGGRRYTGLWNRYQAFVDLSHLLKTNRAVLIAVPAADTPVGEHSGAELLRDGRPVATPRDRHATVYRFVFPVQVESSGS